MPPSIFILAGEASGDRIGADLMARLGQKVDASIEGVGGHTMQSLGLRSIFPMSDLAVMGLIDVLKHLPLLLFRLRQVRLHILRSKPDVVVLIDSQVFSALLAKGLRRGGYSGAILLYVAPTVWVYKPERARKLVSLFDEVLAILPFEPDIMAKLDGPSTCFVGHPALRNRNVTPLVRQSNKIALMPGSRLGELKRHLPMFFQVVKTINNERSGLKFYLPTLPHLEETLRDQTSNWGVDLEIIVNPDRRRQMQSDVCMALAVSGTATLELAFLNIPMVVTYVMDAAQARTYNKITLDHISLPNIILNEPLVPELLFSKPDATRLTNSVRELLDSAEAQQAQIDGFARMASLMETGRESYPRQDPAERVMSYLK